MGKRKKNKKESKQNFKDKICKDFVVTGDLDLFRIRFGWGVGGHLTMQDGSQIIFDSYIFDDFVRICVLFDSYHISSIYALGILNQFIDSFREDFELHEVQIKKEADSG